jgi:N-acetylmuramoyl-L-alanine amidase
MRLRSPDPSHSITRQAGACRRRRRSRWPEPLLVWTAAFLVVAAKVAAGGALAADATIDDVRIGSHGAATRVVIDLSGPVGFRHMTLSEPPRLAIDLPDVAWTVADDPEMQEVGLVKGFRFGHPRPGVSRIVLDLAQPFAVDRVFELQPNGERGHRIVTDLVEAPVNGAQADAANGVVAPSASAKAAALVIARLPAKKPTPPALRHIVVIDPGHGGRDPGAIGRTARLVEKQVALRMGLALRDQLEATGRYEVVMTRDEDRLVRLRDRLEIARKSEGELFVSLHADSLVNAPRVSGASVYTLSERASNAEAARLARKENRADILAGVDLSDQEDTVTEILIDLAQRDANNKSITVAELLVEELGHATDMAKRARAQAGFVVLKSPDMPSVLIELGYLSNPDDEQALADPAYIEKLATAVVRAIARHFGFAPS